MTESHRKLPLLYITLPFCLPGVTSRPHGWQPVLVRTCQHCAGWIRSSCADLGWNNDCLCNLTMRVLSGQRTDPKREAWPLPPPHFVWIAQDFILCFVCGDVFCRSVEDNGFQNKKPTQCGMPCLCCCYLAVFKFHGLRLCPKCASDISAAAPVLGLIATLCGNNHSRCVTGLPGAYQWQKQRTFRLSIVRRPALLLGDVPFRSCFLEKGNVKLQCRWFSLKTFLLFWMQRKSQKSPPRSRAFVSQCLVRMFFCRL